MQLPRVSSSRANGDDAEPEPQPAPATNLEPEQAEPPTASTVPAPETGNLHDPESFQHIAVFADALFRSLPSDLGLGGFYSIAPALERSIKNHSFTVACDGKDDPLTEATCQWLGYLVYRHRR
ncbi:uncharacterized protein PG986_002237 [Apiospora aurea]|uniref:Uncharacterized protein n=1 Tax=Apiospora aurea TaxID=335848 RepID=A0ABR1QZ56_9PEZI